MKNVRGTRQKPVMIMLGDALSVLLSYVAAYYLRFGHLSGFRERIPLGFLFIMMLSYLVVFYFFDLYEPKKKYVTLTSFLEVLFGVLGAGVLISFLKYSLFLFPIGRGIFVIASSLIVVSAFLWRTLCFQLFKFLIRPKRAVIIGVGKAGRDLANLIESTANDFNVIGFIDDGSQKKDGPDFERQQDILGNADSLVDVLENYRIDQIVLSHPAETIPSLTKPLIEARLKGIEIADLPEMYQFLKGKIPINHLPEAWFLESQRFGISEKNYITRIKRLIDIVFSCFILSLSLPLWLLIALAIKINSKGPVIYKQQRIGKNETAFPLYKFRSMIDKAEKDRAVWADVNDIRITFVGNMLRKSHLDELPQLLNVIKGEMSLVGPRPERPEFVEDLKKIIPYYSFRHIMKPGLTGWAQVNFPYASSFEESHEKLEYDLYYISRVNLLLDLRILLKTAKSMIFGKKSKGNVKKNENSAANH